MKSRWRLEDRAEDRGDSEHLQGLVIRCPKSDSNNKSPDLVIHRECMGSEWNIGPFLDVQASDCPGQIENIGGDRSKVGWYNITREKLGNVTDSTVMNFNHARVKNPKMMT